MCQSGSRLALHTLTCSPSRCLSTRLPTRDGWPDGQRIAFLQGAAATIFWVDVVAVDEDEVDEFHGQAIRLDDLQNAVIGIDFDLDFVAFALRRQIIAEGGEEFEGDFHDLLARLRIRF